jgi:DNA modification methylase
VHIITHEVEGAVLANIKRKESAFLSMHEGMVKHMSDITKSEIHNGKKYIDNYDPSEKSEGDWTLYNDDCCERIKKIPDDSIHYSIFSPPFASLFTYSNSPRDMGNSKCMDEFMEHFKFMAKELFRVIMDGRLISFHVMNLSATITSDGFIGVKDLRGDLIRVFQNAGFIFHSEVCIWKDPLIQAVRTKTLTLAHKQISKDSTRCAQGLADYVITMRKTGLNQEPVSHGRGFENYIGEDEEPQNPKTDNPRGNKYSHNVWRRYASPVWMDIRQTRTLNERVAREENDEKHMCPLQLDVIDRCLDLWSNEGDVVFSPFAGIGSEGYCALEMGRKFIGIELKKSYFDVAVSNLQFIVKDIKSKKGQISLFDVMDETK